MIDLIFAHPYPQRSRANRRLLEALHGLPGLDVRSLYDMYPDFAIDVEAEQSALLRARIVIWQHPMYWYSVPPLLKLWFDKVLDYGWAYGDGKRAVQGKVCQWVTTTGGDGASFGPQGAHAQPFASFVPPIEQTARFCGMRWETPFVVHGSHRISDVTLQQLCLRFRATMDALVQRENKGLPHE
jgi:glutathione-regulated potassium-efflux system ancillary protein KefF